ncbi:fungal fucose-specific lectin-domain-containing protein [Geopyxis carbonaria]|nr:fungal fucose-specific lectin-domain-containing protein [Geopyxis carbonaria]
METHMRKRKHLLLAAGSRLAEDSKIDNIRLSKALGFQQVIDYLCAAPKRSGGRSTSAQLNQHLSVTLDLLQPHDTRSTSSSSPTPRKPQSQSTTARSHHHVRHRPRFPNPIPHVPPSHSLPTRLTQTTAGTGIAAVNAGESMRIYTQDTAGAIRETLYEPSTGWANGTAANTIASAKPGSPIAATSRGLTAIRVFSISAANTLQETRYDQGRSWSVGKLGAAAFPVAPWSKLAATFLANNTDAVRVYAQLPDGSVQEYGWDGDSPGWLKMATLGAALTGSALAATSYYTNQLSLRVYMQTPSLSLGEKCYDAAGSRGWYTGDFKVPAGVSPPRACLAAASFRTKPQGPGAVSLRVYYGTKMGQVKEKAWDGGWAYGVMEVPVIPGSEAAVVDWMSDGAALHMRVFVQDGTLVTAVTEWVFNMLSGEGWKIGRRALPPAV